MTGIGPTPVNMSRMRDRRREVGNLPFTPPRVGIEKRQISDSGLGPRFETSRREWRIGHLQERLLASVYTLRPDFPTVEALGFGVDATQTATGYRELIAQDPGWRILRADLVTPDARLTCR